MLANLSSDIKQYLVVTGNYWAFTLTDGALRMLVVLHFHSLGYSPLQIAMLFLFYEIFGVITNLCGGWLGARIGLNRTMNIGLFLQILALGMLLVPAAMLTVPWVMAAQALSGTAKDLNKMSAKSAIKILVPADAQNSLYQWVALLTGSKNALKGAGFFMGGALLTAIGFAGAVMAMTAGLLLVFLTSLLLLKKDLGRATNKPRFTDIFSGDPAINRLSAARMFLFSARDVWFVVALPVYLSQTLDWDHWQTGGFLAAWVIAYGIVQALAPRLTGIARAAPDGRNALRWACILATVPALIALGLMSSTAVSIFMNPATVLIVGLMMFGVVFAINSALHSYLIVSYARADGVSLDVGFYYMANAMGRLLGTVLSGWVFQVAGLVACLWISCAMIVLTALISIRLPARHQGLSS
ncbi:organoarsenical effux MFS transporter ArsJ [Pseudohongiella sp.]|uniref:Major facilitator superfamily (MFS) profile domain-containing protein n=1 Tax=marine sediment metagenome TaxID=412755 RepID=A0A0F9YVQ2_9ZZZZ|nr:organoarsenical effux MFS transporter ArsJ [Pseudohongiella sp.]HDZ08597.1 organoarsenical effux MFS transporter ArsJ [Pseudohongiella sp.]HEA64073.1 organoarsenical effux MFS transporter ArsJ [Pseudohongiella sp.]